MEVTPQKGWDKSDDIDFHTHDSEGEPLSHGGSHNAESLGVL